MSNFTGGGLPGPQARGRKEKKLILDKMISVQSFVSERVDLLREIKSKESRHLPRGSRTVMTVKLGQLAIA